MIGGVTQRTEPARAAASRSRPERPRAGMVRVPSDDVMPAVFLGTGRR
jgi:hypothetical protein